MILLLSLGVTTPAWAVDPFEIQVYEGDINDRLQASLEVHGNFVAAGRRAAAFPGEAVPHHTWRITLEPSLGALEWWELGAYLQFATALGRSEAHFGGFKLRSKLVVPRRHTGAFTVGLNMELGRGVAALGSDQWDTEFRPIGRWFAALNPIIGWALSGDTSAAPDLEACAKLRVDTGLAFALGVEYTTPAWGALPIHHRAKTRSTSSTWSPICWRAPST